VATDPESIPAGFCIWFWSRSQAFLKKRTRNQGVCFIFDSNKSLHGLYKLHCFTTKQTLLNCGCIDGCRRLNRNRIVRSSKFRTLDRIQKLWNRSGVWRAGEGEMYTRPCLLCNVSVIPANKLSMQELNQFNQNYAPDFRFTSNFSS